MKFSKEDFELLKKLSSLNAIAGNEKEVRDFLKKEYKNLGYSYNVDNMGNIFAFKKSKNPNAKTLLIEGHMDEVGLMVTSIQDDGYILATPVGGLYFNAFISSLLALKTSLGTYIYGTIEAKIDESLKYYVCNFGFNNKQEALDSGVRGGDMIVAQGEVKPLNSYEKIMGKAFDDRFGIALGLEVLKKYQNVDLPFNLYVGGTVQEEVGSRGAYALMYNFKADLVICLDTGFAKAEHMNNGVINKGVLIRHIDGGMVANKKLIAFQKRALSNINGLYQDYYRSQGGTNGGMIHKSLGGIACLSHCIVGVNIHTPFSIISASDYFYAKESLFEMIELLKDEMTFKNLLDNESE